MRKPIPPRTAVAGLACAGLLLLLAACEQEPPSLKIRMVNESGEDMTDFVLDTGSGTIEYQIFTKGYTFAKDVVIERSAPLKLSCRRGSRPVRKQLEFTVDPSQNGGRVMIVFRANKETIDFKPPAS